MLQLKSVLALLISHIMMDINVVPAISLNIGMSIPFHVNNAHKILSSTWIKEDALHAQLINLES